MSYINRFIFKNMPDSSCLRRALSYITHIKSINIDGNIVKAKIDDLDIEGFIDYSEQKFINYKCSCGDNMCEHIASIMLYLDLYINDGSILDMFRCFVMDAVVAHVIQLIDLRVQVKRETIFNSLINRNASKLHFEYDYPIPYEVINRIIDESTLNSGLRRLMSFHVLNKDNRTHTYYIRKEYNNPYRAFYAKYHMLDNDGIHEDKYYEVEQPIVIKGFDVLNNYSFFIKENNNDHLFIDNEYEVIDALEEDRPLEELIYRIVPLSDNNLDKEYIIGKIVSDLLDRGIPFYFYKYIKI